MTRLRSLWVCQGLGPGPEGRAGPPPARTNSRLGPRPRRPRARQLHGVGSGSGRTVSASEVMGHVHLQPVPVNCTSRRTSRHLACARTSACRHSNPGPAPQPVSVGAAFGGAGGQGTVKETIPTVSRGRDVFLHRSISSVAIENKKV